MPAGFSFVSVSPCGSIENATGLRRRARPADLEPLRAREARRRRVVSSPRYLSSQALISPPLLPTSARYKGFDDRGPLRRAAAPPSQAADRSPGRGPVWKPPTDCALRDGRLRLLPSGSRLLWLRLHEQELVHHQQARHEHGGDDRSLFHQSPGRPSGSGTWGRGGGSYPPGCQGWHRAIRRMLSQAPPANPCVSNTWREYSEQLGSNRHAGGRSGLSPTWYTRTTRAARRAGHAFTLQSLPAASWLRMLPSAPVSGAPAGHRHADQQRSA